MPVMPRQDPVKHLEQRSFIIAVLIEFKKYNLMKILFIWNVSSFIYNVYNVSSLSAWISVGISMVNMGTQKDTGAYFTNDFPS